MSCSRRMKFGLALLFITTVMALWGYQRQGWRTTHPQKYNASISVYTKNRRDNHLSPAVVLERQQKQTMAMTTTRSSSTTNTEMLDQNAAAATKGTVPFEKVHSDKEEEVDKNAGSDADYSTDEAKEETSKLHRVVPKIQDHTTLPNWLASYIEFHLQHVVPVLPPHSLRTSHQNQTEHHPKYQLLDSDTTKYLRWTCRSAGCGGLGDRLNGILQTFWVAFCTNRVFLLDDYHGSDLLLQPNRIAWRVDRLPPAATQLSSLDNRNHTLLQDPANLPADSVAIDWQTNLWMEAPNVDSPCWRERLSTTSARDFYRTAFHALFALPPELLRATTQLQEQAGLTTLRKHGGQRAAPPRYYYIAMHVRTGLVVGDAAAKQKRRHSDPVEWRQFAECGHRLQEALHQHCGDIGGGGAALRPELYLAADHTDVKTALLRDDPSIKTVVDLNVVHLDKRARDRTNGGVDDAVSVAWSEWNVLREAVCLVMSHSKYSQTAADTMTTPRCALYFDECDAAHVDRAIANLPVCVDDADAAAR